MNGYGHIFQGKKQVLIKLKPPLMNQMSGFDWKIVGMNYTGENETIYLIRNAFVFEPIKTIFKSAAFFFN